MYINKYSFIYKTFIFKKVYFKTNNEDLKLIVDALNIKNNKKRINYIYDTCCDIIDNKYKNINICGFNCHKCLNNIENGCCKNCMYQSINGCPSKNLTCKLFYCSKVKEKYDVIKYEDLKLLKLFNLKQRYIIQIDYFAKREEVLKDLYSISFIYSFIRILIRQIKNIYLINKNKI